jgi:hypothetical protein
MKGTGSCPSGGPTSESRTRAVRGTSPVSIAFPPRPGAEYSVIGYTKWYLAQMRGR